MSSVSSVIELPVRHGYDERVSLEYEIVRALATDDDLESGMGQVVGRIRRESGAARIGCWAAADDGALDLVAAAGFARGRRGSLPLGSAGVLVLHGGRLNPQIAWALTALTPILGRRAAEERLARTTIRLGRRDEALEDFAALVAHELKTPLQGALVADHSSRYAGSGLGLSLCRRIAARFGGALELTPLPSGGTRATLEFDEALR